MKKLTPIFLLFALTMTAPGCTNAQDEKVEPFPFGGKFVFSSLREGIAIKDNKTYILENGKIREVAGRLGNPKWSPDGKEFIVSAADKHLIYIYTQNGLLREEIPTDGYPVDPQFFPDQKKILYGTKESSNNYKDSLFRIFIYDLETKQSVLVRTFEKNQHLMKLHLSHDGSKFAYSLNDPVHFKAPRELGVFDVQTKKLKTYHPNTFSVVGWYPGDKQMLVWGNRKESGNSYNDRFGVLGIIDVESEEFKVLREESHFYSFRSLSKDGKYIIYTRNFKKTQCIFVNELATDKEYQVTYPQSIGSTGYFSKDDYADWYQETR